MVKEIQWSKHAEESFTEISDILILGNYRIN